MIGEQSIELDDRLHGIRIKSWRSVSIPFTRGNFFFSSQINNEPVKTPTPLGFLTVDTCEDGQRKTTRSQRSTSNNNNNNSNSNNICEGSNQRRVKVAVAVFNGQGERPLRKEKKKKGGLCVKPGSHLYSSAVIGPTRIHQNGHTCRTGPRRIHHHLKFNRDKYLLRKRKSIHHHRRRRRRRRRRKKNRKKEKN